MNRNYFMLHILFVALLFSSAQTCYKGVDQPLTNPSKTSDSSSDSKGSSETTSNSKESSDSSSSSLLDISKLHLDDADVDSAVARVNKTVKPVLDNGKKTKDTLGQYYSNLEKDFGDALSALNSSIRTEPSNADQLLNQIAKAIAAVTEMKVLLYAAKQKNIDVKQYYEDVINVDDDLMALASKLYVLTLSD